ncbi:MAG: hypothetical protein CMO80_23280 [Verrucomicrobiales bacterium]|nr:hypothetical protein [Verrucomicrobiales bacterium]
MFAAERQIGQCANLFGREINIVMGEIATLAKKLAGEGVTDADVNISLARLLKNNPGWFATGAAFVENGRPGHERYSARYQRTDAGFLTHRQITNYWSYDQEWHHQALLDGPG